MVVKRLELRMTPEAPGVAPGHAHDVRHASDLGGEMTRNPIGLKVVRVYDVERTLGMHARGRRGELGDEGARQRNVKL